MVREQIAAPNRSEPRMHTFHACQQHHMCPCPCAPDAQVSLLSTRPSWRPLRVSHTRSCSCCQVRRLPVAEVPSLGVGGACWWHDVTAWPALD